MLDKYKRNRKKAKQNKTKQTRKEKVLDMDMVYKGIVMEYPNNGNVKMVNIGYCFFIRDSNDPNKYLAMPFTLKQNGKKQLIFSNL